MQQLWKLDLFFQRFFSLYIIIKYVCNETTNHYITVQFMHFLAIDLNLWVMVAYKSDIIFKINKGENDVLQLHA